MTNSSKDAYTKIIAIRLIIIITLLMKMIITTVVILIQCKSSSEIKEFQRFTFKNWKKTHTLKITIPTFSMITTMNQCQLIFGFTSVVINISISL
jgi:hypothetical protein